jgi:hypothetical protein
VAGSVNPLLKLTNSDGGTGGIYTSIYKNSTTPAIGDILGVTSYYGNNVSSIKTEFANTSISINTINAPNPTAVVNHNVLRYVSGSSSALTSMFSLHGNYNGRPTILLNPTATNMDTRIIGTSASSPAIYVDSSTNYVGIGKTNPTVHLDINGYLYATSVATPVIQQLSQNPTGSAGELTFSRQYDNTTGSSMPITNPSLPGETAILINAYQPITVYATNFSTDVVQVQQCVLQYNGYTYSGGQYSIYQIDANGSVVYTWSLSGGTSTPTCYAIEFNSTDGNIWVGGDFTSINGTTCNYIATLNISSYGVSAVVDSSSYAEGFNSVVYALQYCGGYQGGAMAIGGNMTGAGSGSSYYTNPQNIALYYGTSPYYYDTSFASNCYASGGQVYALAWGYHASYGEVLYIGGSGFYSSASGASYFFFYSPSSNSSYTTYNTITALVRAITYINQNEILIGGDFSSLYCSGDSSYANYILRWDTSSNVFYTISNSAPSTVYCILDQSNFGGYNFIWIGGSYYTSFPNPYSTITWIVVNSNGYYLSGNASSSYSIYQWTPGGITPSSVATFTTGIPIQQQGGSAEYYNVSISATGYTCMLRTTGAAPFTKWYVISQTGCTFT